MIKTVNGVKIGDTFVFGGDEFEITGFRSRCTVFGKIKNYKLGGPDTCKVSIKDVTMKGKGILTEESYKVSK
jgi:hypothetical protein